MPGLNRSLYLHECALYESSDHTHLSVVSLLVDSSHIPISPPPQKKAKEQTIKPPLLIFPPHGFDFVALDFQPELGTEREGLVVVGGDSPGLAFGGVAPFCMSARCSRLLRGGGSSGSAGVGLQTCLSATPEIKMTT